MSHGLVTSTSSEGLQALGSAAQRSWEMLTGILRDRLGPEAATLLAEPVSTRQGGLIEWYAPDTGTAAPVSSLAAEDQAALRRSLDATVARILALAEDLAAQKTEEGFWQAEALRNAVQVPDEGAIWALRAPDGSLRPVLVNWGRLPDDSRAVRGVLTAVTQRAQPVAPPPAPMAAPVAQAAPQPMPVAAPVAAAAASAFPLWLLWLGWLLLALMLAAILWLLLAPCGLRPGFLGPCRAGGSEPVASAEAAALRADIAVLEAGLADRDRACVAGRPRAERPTPPTGEPAMERQVEDLDRRLQDRGAQIDTAMTVSLVWSGIDDLDLQVRCPNGDRIDWRRQTGQCGGVLDVDANYPPGSGVPDPVENVAFSRLMQGRYTIAVSRASDHPPTGPQSFAVIVRRKGLAEQRFTGTTAGQGQAWTQDIEVTP